METTAEILWDRLLRSDPGPTAENVYDAMLLYPELRKVAWPVFLKLDPRAYEVARVFKTMPELRREAVNVFLDMGANDSEISYYVNGEDPGSVMLAQVVLERLEAAPVTKTLRFLLFFFRFAREEAASMRNLTLRKIIKHIPGLRSRAWRELKARYPTNTLLTFVVVHYPEAREEAVEILFTRRPDLYDLARIAEHAPTHAERAINMALERNGYDRLIEFVSHGSVLRERVRTKLFSGSASKDTLLSWLSRVRHDHDLDLWKRFLALEPTDMEVALVAVGGYGNLYVPLAVEELHRRDVKNQEILEAVFPNLPHDYPHYEEFAARIDLALAKEKTLWCIFRHSRMRNEAAGRELLTQFELTNEEIDAIVNRFDSLRDLARVKVRPTTDQVMRDLQARKNRESA